MVRQSGPDGAGNHPADPDFLHYWAGDTLAAWLAIHAVGNLVFVADAGLQFREIERFLQFKSAADCDGRTARLYEAIAADLPGLIAAMTVLLLVGIGDAVQTVRVVAVSHFETDD